MHEEAVQEQSLKGENRVKEASSEHRVHAKS
jgi:hypothetical protein